MKLRKFSIFSGVTSFFSVGDSANRGGSLFRLSRRAALALVLASGWTSLARAEVRLPKVFGSHMVLQREKPLVLWGWAEPNETISVSIGPDESRVQANHAGEWKAELAPMKAGGPYTLSVSGSTTVRCDDVMIGEVWLCSGQSNMEMGIGRVDNAEEEIANANHPNIRLFMVPNRWTPVPQDDLAGGEWKVCTPENVAEGGWSGFSAAGYFFGRELNRELGVAVGLIDATWGGTRIESWTPPEGFASVPALQQDYERVQLADPRAQPHRQRLQDVIEATQRWVAEARKALENRTLVPPMPEYPSELMPPSNVQSPTALFNGMIHPLCPYPMRGAIWYQGEANLNDGALYAERMKALVGGWRQIWDEGDFPFYFVQIAPYNYGGDPEREAELWEAQARAGREIPNAGMAVINDIGNLADIHPKNKQEVGHRLALLALANTYGRNHLIAMGPTFQSMTIENDKLRVRFDHVGQGLSSRDGKPPSWFEIIDADEGGFVPAKARIDGSSVVLSAPGVNHPVAVRFAWSMMAEPNLVNSAGLPASAFRAGDIPQRDLLEMKVPEAKDYEVVYDLDLAKLGPDFSYAVDRHRETTAPFDRVAYFLELQESDGNMRYLYVSMDTFTDDPAKLGVPTLESGAHFQQNVAGMNVYSNVRGVRTGTGLDGGNIEFWPNNYRQANAAGVPNASAETFDFGDQPTEPRDGYGSMQVHNHDARQTLFALNHWKEGKNADVGIGNQPEGNPDWTFAGNSGSYRSKRLRVLVRRVADHAGR